MIVATWNINSIRMRLPRLVQWLESRRPDVLCLQETKVVDGEFPLEPLRELGYQCFFKGEKSYNGVAILSRGIPAQTADTLPGDDADTQCRFLAADISGVRIVNIYAPNGQEVGSPKYAYKLAWYARLKNYFETHSTPSVPVLLCGDFNIAPEDRDVWDPEQWRGQILCSDQERVAYKGLLDWGFIDAVRLLRQESGLYTWWDYRGGAFHRGWGMRIDHILVTGQLKPKCAAVEVDREARKGEKPSDHAPVMITLD
jgi:exodeoxyribonuclease III